MRSDGIIQVVIVKEHFCSLNIELLALGDASILLAEGVLVRYTRLPPSADASMT